MFRAPSTIPGVPPKKRPTAIQEQAPNPGQAGSYRAAGVSAPGSSPASPITTGGAMGPRRTPQPSAFQALTASLQQQPAATAPRAATPARTATSGTSTPMPTVNVPGGLSGTMGGAATGGGPEGLNINANPSPEMARAVTEYQQRQASLAAAGGGTDPNQEWQIAEYKRRMGEDNTRRMTDQAASAIRDQMAGQQARAGVAGAANGQGQGYQAGSIAESGQRALAAQAAKIQLDRAGQVDNLLTAGNQIMQAPGQRALAYQGLQNQAMGLSPYEAQARLGLAQQGLGLQAYLGQGGLQNQAQQIANQWSLGQTEAANQAQQIANQTALANAQINGSPWELYRLYAQMMG